MCIHKLYIYIYIYIYALNKIINATLFFLPPFLMSCTQRSKTFSMYTKGLFLSNIVHKSVWGGSKNQSLSGVTTICLTQGYTSPSHRVDQVVDCGLWNVGPLFNGCVKLLDIGRNWNTLSYTPIQSIPNMLNG